MTRRRRGSVLLEAHKVINGERLDAYGRPEDAFDDIALIWSWWRGKAMAYTAKDVAVMMALLKIARERHAPKRDNLIDAAGYLGIAGDLQ